MVQSQQQFVGSVRRREDKPTYARNSEAASKTGFAPSRTRRLIGTGARPSPVPNSGAKSGSQTDLRGNRARFRSGCPVFRSLRPQPPASTPKCITGHFSSESATQRQRPPVALVPSFRAQFSSGVSAAGLCSLNERPGQKELGAIIRLRRACTGRAIRNARPGGAECMVRRPPARGTCFCARCRRRIRSRRRMAGGAWFRRRGSGTLPANARRRACATQVAGDRVVS